MPPVMESYSTVGEFPIESSLLEGPGMPFLGCFSADCGICEAQAEINSSFDTPIGSFCRFS